jgi:hypothetical protein
MDTDTFVERELEKRRIRQNLRVALERDLRLRGLGQAHIERVLRLSYDWQPGFQMRGLRITPPGRYRMITDTISKGEVIRRYGRDAWGALEQMHAMVPVITKDGRRKFVGYQMIASLQRLDEAARG